MIRSTTASDVPAILQLAKETGVFKPVEIMVLKDVLGDYLKKPGGDGYHFYTFEGENEVAGFSCHGPNTMTDGTWDLYWIAVRKDMHRAGIGGELLRFVEDDIRRLGGRLLMVETSSLPSYDATRQFYLKHNYEQSAVIKDFYADGDSLVLFKKRLVRDTRD